MQKGVTTSVYCKNTNPVPVDQYGVHGFQSKCDCANSIDSDVIARNDHHVPENLDSLPSNLLALEIGIRSKAHQASIAWAQCSNDNELYQLIHQCFLFI